MWGDNSFGQLGDGSTTERLSPTTVPGLSNVVQLATGAVHTLARLAAAEFSIENFGDGRLGHVVRGTNRVVIDADAGGYGWQLGTAGDSTQAVDLLSGRDRGVVVSPSLLPPLPAFDSVQSVDLHLALPIDPGDAANAYQPGITHVRAP